MSERLQYDFHPDADQISAFVEQALPEHERTQMLDHLAVCPECRAIVALSLPAVAEAPKPVTAPVRKPWLSGWVLAWPALGALAAAAFFFIYFHRVSDAPNLPPQQQVAEAKPPVQPPAKEEPPITASRPKSGQPGAGGIAAKSAKPGLEIPIETTGAVVLTGRNAAALAQSTVQSAPAAGTGSGGARGEASGAESGRMPAPAVAGQLQPAPPVLPVGAPMAVVPATTAAAATPPATDAAVVSGAQPMPAESATVSSFETSANELKVAPMRHHLPSRQPVLSTAAQGPRVIAIDTHNAVFLSDDGGAHWKAIRTPWQGRAVKAGLAVSPVRRGAEFAADKPLSPAAPPVGGPLSGASLNNALALPKQRRSGTALEGTVTDQTGAVIAGATVVATNKADGTARRVVTDGEGHYSLDGIAAGDYRVEALAPGFRKQQLTSTVAGAAATVANLTLDVGESSQTVSVQAASTAEIATQTLPPASQNTSEFEITTESGEHWTSPDGVTWTRR